MPTLTIPEETFQRLTRRASALKISLEDLALPALEGVAEEPSSTRRRTLTHGEWLANLDAWMAEVQTRAHRYPPGFRVDYSRESIYEGCGE